jgi:hypothetical protein
VIIAIAGSQFYSLAFGYLDAVEVAQYGQYGCGVPNCFLK